MISWPAKDPADVADYVWTVTLDDADTIATLDTVTVLEGTVVVDSSAVAGSMVTLWLSGGADGELAMISLAITTEDARTFREVAAIPVFDRAVVLLAMFRIRFPAFADVADESVGHALLRAARQVDDTWTEDDLDSGKMLLAAHYLTIQGLGTGAEAEAAANGTGDYRVIRTGSVTLERFDRSAATADGSIGSTSYGRQFTALARVNVGGPRVMGTGALPTSSPASA